MRTRVSTLVALSVLLAAVPVIVVAQDGAHDQPAQRNASSPPSSDEGAACIPQTVDQGLTHCPANAPHMHSGGVPSAPAAHLQDTKRRTHAKKQGPTGPSIQIDAATRRNQAHVQARSWALLKREVTVLQRLVRNTSRNNPQRPDILLRLAETYFEMEQALETQVHSLDQPIYDAQHARNAARYRALKHQQDQANHGLHDIREQAIRTYAILVHDHPNYRKMDEVLFSLAFGLDELRQFDRARQVYKRLIKGFPQSRFIPHAWLSFAEYYFGTGDMAAATQFYDKVLSFPPDRNPVYGYALYKEAWAKYNLQDFHGSLQRFVDVIQFAQQHPDAAQAPSLARQSRKELVMPYAMVGTPDRALEFFQRYAKDHAQALDMLESLGELYYDTGKWPKVMEVYHQLIAESPNSDKVCRWQSRVTNAVISSKPKADQVTEIQRLVDIADAWGSDHAHSHSADAVQQCKQTTAEVIVVQATAWHREAIGTDTQPGTGDHATMQLAARLYKMVIDKFPNMEHMRFPDLDRRDWPTVYKVSYYYAELLWKMEDWDRCGPAFDHVVELNPQGEYTADAAYAAVLCYNNLYQQQYQAHEHDVRHVSESSHHGGHGRHGHGHGHEAQPQTDEFAARPFTALEQGMLRAFQRYICFVPNSQDLATIKYRRARIYYESNHYEQAAVLFKDIAFHHSDNDLGVYAANLYLDSLNVLGTKSHPARTSCLDDISSSIEPLSHLYCNTQEDKDNHSDLCGVLGQLRCDIMRKKAEAYHSNHEFKRAAATEVGIFRRYPECGRLDEVLYNAAIDFEAARLLGRAIQVRKVLIDHYADSEYAKKAIYLIGANFHALAFYAQAADYYEQFAKKYPGEDGHDCTASDRSDGTCAIAHEALQNAVLFRLGLGNDDQAISDAHLFERNYRRKLPRETSQVIFSLGSIYERQENWNKVVDHFKKFLHSYGRQALPQQVIRANVEIAKAYLKANDANRAEGYFKSAVHAWAAAPQKINAMSDLSQADKLKYLKDAIDATAEALFELANYKYQEVQHIHFPAFRGAPTLDRVNHWAQHDFKDWVQKKLTAIHAAETEYNKVAALTVPITGSVTLNSPPWMIAAAARVGEMYRTFVDQFRDAPIPDKIQKDPDLFEIYVNALDTQSRPFQQAAIQKFEFCLRTATNVRWFNEYSRQCEMELNKLNPHDYPLADELRNEPTYVYQQLGQARSVDLGHNAEDTSMSQVGHSGEGQSSEPSSSSSSGGHS